MRRIASALYIILATLAFLAVAVLTGCSSTYVELVVMDERTVSVEEAEDELPTVVADACDLLGFACAAREDRNPRGAITIWLFDLPFEHSGKKGRAVYDGDCASFVWVDVGPEEGDGRITPPESLLAHELGHALSLEHRPAEERDNLMSEASEGDELDEEQIDTMTKIAGRFERCL